MKQVLKILSVNLAILLVVLLPVEVLWRMKLSKDVRYSLNVLADTKIYFDVSNLYKSNDGKIFYSRDANGFRGNYKSINDIEMIVIGGSTTDQKYIDNKQTWDQVLRAHLSQELHRDVTIVNAGISGQSTYGHLKNFELWFSKFKDLRPRYMLFYVGNNDFYVNEGNTYDELALRSAPITKFIKESSLYHLYRVTRGMLQAKKAMFAYNGDRKRHPRDCQKTRFPLIRKESYEAIMKKRLYAYRTRLTALAKKTRELGAVPIFVTQRSLAYSIENNQVIGVSDAGPYDRLKVNGVDMYYMFKLLNKTTMDTCKEVKGICIDLESELQFTDDDFYDIAHNTSSGTAKIGNYLSEKLKNVYK